MNKNKFHNSNLSHHLSRNFSTMSAEAIAKILEQGEEMLLETGEYLFKQGDTADVLYILLSGRLRAIKKEADESRVVLGDIGAGEPVGEFAFFTQEPRMASVLAIRDSVVLRFNEQSYQHLVRQNPEIATMLIQFIIKRLKRNAFETSRTSPPKNIAILSLQSEELLADYINEIKAEFDKMTIPAQIYSFDNQSEETQNNLFDTLEKFDGLNILTCNAQHKEWSKTCIIYADLVIVATDFYAKNDLYEIEQELGLYSQNILNKRTYLLLLHHIKADAPLHTDKWLAKRNVFMHLHLRKNNLSDIRRFCRIVTHKAIGLVLGGGGAKGFAHVGVVKALYEKGFEIDFLGGTSAGALYGLGMSYADFQFDKVRALNEEAVRRKLTSNDITLPLVSMMSGKKFKKYLKETFKEHTIEDLWITSFAVSTNFSQAKMEVHKSGLLWKKVFASMAIPGIFPPVVIDKNLHVDGGVMDNLPIESMYYYPVETIIAVSLSNFDIVDVDYAEAPSSWRLAWDKISLKKRYTIPGLASIVINSLTINSQQKQELAKHNVTHYINLNLMGFGMLDDTKWQEILQNGYDQTMSYFNDIEKDK